MMHLKSIAIANVRKFTQPVVLAPLRPGINIIAGDNEDGKSTIVSAVKAALYKKYSSATADDLQPYNSSIMPSVSLEFDWDGGNYRLIKTFGRKGTAELRGPGGIVLSGSQAEEKIRELLRLGEEKRSNSSIWNVLLVEQGKALQVPELSETGKHTLETALEKEIGKMISGDTGQALLNRVTQLYSAWFTDTGRIKQTSELKQLEKEFEPLCSEYDRKLEEYESYKHTLDELEATRAALKQHADGGTLEAAKKRVEEADAAARVLEALVGKLQMLVSNERAEQANYAQISQLWQARKQISDQLSAVETSIAQIDARCDALQKSIDTAARQLHELQQTEHEAESALRAAEQNAAEADKGLQAAHLFERRRVLEDALTKARAAQVSATEAKKKAADIKVDRAALERLKVLEKKLFQCQAQLEAAATRLQFKPATGNCVRSNGSEVDTGEPFLVTETTTFELNGWGTLDVVPGAQAAEQSRKMHMQVSREFAEALAAVGVSDVAEAEEKERQKTALLLKSEEHARDIGKFAPNGCEVIESELAALTKQAAELDTTEPPQLTVAEATAAHKAAAREAQQRLNAFNIARQAAEDADRLFRKRTEELATASAEKKSAQTTLQDLNERLSLLRSQESDNELAQRLAEARARMERATLDKEALATQLKSSTVDPREQVTAAVSSFERLQKEIDSLRDKQNVLSGSLKTFGKAGIAEEFHKIAGRKEQLQSQLDRLQKRAAAIKLLYETMIQAQQSAKKQLMRPLVMYLQPYVHQVFDGAHLELNSDRFGVTHLSRESISESYSSLSIGTQEQLSVLARLAFAHVLSQNGCPVFLILDDVLVYSDQARLLKMQEALKKAADHFQIIILTCRASDWHQMGEPVLELKKISAPELILASAPLPAPQPRC